MNNILIDIEIDKEPYIKKITDDKIINLTGESGSGKSYYTNQYKDNDNYIIVDTDEVFSRYEKSTGINKELGTMFRNKYKELPKIVENFEMIYLDILEYFKDCQKTIIIDSAQFRNMKNVNNLKGTIIIMRTSITTCYKRCIERYKETYPNATSEEITKYSEKKKAIYQWYKGLNNFIEQIDKI